MTFTNTNHSATILLRPLGSFLRQSLSLFLRCRFFAFAVCCVSAWELVFPHLGQEILTLNWLVGTVESDLDGAFELALRSGDVRFHKEAAVVHVLGQLRSPSLR